MKVGSIYVDIKGDTSPLDKSLDKARKMATSGAKKVQGAYANTFDKLRKASGKATAAIAAGWKSLASVLVAGAASIAAIGAAVITSATAQKELSNLARTAGTTTQEFVALSHAADRFNITGEQLADISKDVKDKLGDFIATGGGEFADFFENIAPKVGLTAKALQDLSGPDVLIAVKKAMDDVGVSAEEQIFYLESIGNDASKLIPLLKEEGKGFRDAAITAAELGLALSDVDHGNLLTAGTATKEFTSAFGAAKDMIAAEFAPLFAEVMETATGLIVSFKDEAREVAGAVVNVASSAKGWKAVFEGKLGLLEFAKMDANELNEWLKKSAGSVVELEAKSTSASSSMTAGQDNFNTSLATTNKLTNEQLKKAEESLKGFKEAADEKAAAEEEMFNEAGLGAEAHYSKEASDLVQKVANWQKAGADVFESEQWLYEQIQNLSEEAWANNETTAGLAMDSLLAQTSTLVDEMNSSVESGMDKLDEYGIKVGDLDGSAIGITVALDGSGVVSEIDSLIEKFDQLRGAAATPGQQAPVSNAQPFENTDPNLTAAQVASRQTTHNNTTVNINQNLSRSDVLAITTEQNRQEAIL